MQRYDDFIWQWCQIKHVMRNGAKWCEMMLFDCIISQLIVKGLSKNHLISLVLMNSFLKSPRPSLPLKRAPPLSPSPFSHGEGWLHSAIWKRAFIALICTTFPLRGQGMCQPPYSVLKPLRYKVGGPSEVSPAAELRFAVCDRMDTNRLRAAWCLLEVCLVLARSFFENLPGFP